MNTNIFEKIYKIAESERMNEMARANGKALPSFVRFISEVCLDPAYPDRNLDLQDLYRRTAKGLTRERDDMELFRDLNLVYYMVYPSDVGKNTSYGLGAIKNKGMDNPMFNLSQKDLDVEEMHYRGIWGKPNTAYDPNATYYFGVKALDYFGLLREDFNATLSKLDSMGYNVSKDDAIADYKIALDSLEYDRTTSAKEHPDRYNPEFEGMKNYIKVCLIEEGEGLAKGETISEALDKICDEMGITRGELDDYKMTLCGYWDSFEKRHK